MRNNLSMAKLQLCVEDIFPKHYIKPVTVNYLDSGHCRELELVSSLARVRNNESLLSQMSVICFSQGFNCCLYYQGVRYSGVSARRELTVIGWQVFKSHNYNLNSLLQVCPPVPPFVFVVLFIPLFMFWVVSFMFHPIEFAFPSVWILNSVTQLLKFELHVQQTA